MKTTEVFVEQVLIGLLVLTGVALIAFPGALRGWLEAGRSVELSVDKLLGGAALVAIAYLVGIVYDRFADTLLQDLEQHQRLEFETHGESHLRLNILHQGGAVADYSDYLRTRMRLTRSVATLLPALGVGWVSFVTPSGCSSCWSWCGREAPWVLLGTYAVLFLWKLFRLWPRPPRDETEPGKVDAYKRKWVWVEPTHRWPRRLRGRVVLLLREPLAWGLGLVTALAFCIGGSDTWFPPTLVAALTLLTGWTWWRIGRTDARLLKDYASYLSSRQSGGRSTA